MGRRQMKNGDEVDAYGKARHMYVYLQRAGVVKKIKRATHKRERREGKASVNEYI
jgi:hypothetical protein